ncbi:hypothetical protein A2115_00640 [Candidatus Woesebacteria bacterium GWA1_41_8]|uniref:Glycosyltransferase RgtA/B/C/D-like domain-containing protein n=1 Tax=Candidatus Woesebacteria bacterium GWA1_41_8 TaxID=1802471 RepID=A0A1F7WK32_9BACT|nr:MAG: hypothetical protein A2115_00640 [Candidatus Woesebacteria bacterium GWA1_41_8]
MSKKLTINNFLEKAKKNFNEQAILLVILLVFGLFLRTTHLDVVPPGLANDEANIILNGQSIAVTGKSIPGVVTGVVGQPTGNYIGGVHSEISSFLLSLVYRLVGFSNTTARLPFALASVGVSVFIYLLAKLLFNRRVANIAFALSVINPWLIHFGRAGYEGILSCFFYLWGIYVYVSRKDWKVLYSLPLFFAGFLSYFAAKTLLLPITLVLVLYSIWFAKKASFKPLIVFNLIVALFIAGYFAVLRNDFSGRRIQELKNTSLAPIVDDKRTHAIKAPFVNLVENKAVENLDTRIKNALGGVSANFLFVNGMPEPSGHLSIPEHGPLYMIDLLLLAVGLAYLAKKHTKKLVIVGLLAVTTLVPNFLEIDNSTYSMRPVILIPVLLIVIAFGLYFILYQMKNIKYKVAVVVGLCVVYLFLFARFSFQYYFRMPIVYNSAWFFQDRLATRYITDMEKHYPQERVVWVAPSFHYTFYRFLFFSELYQKIDDIQKANNLLENKTYTINNLSIVNECPKDYSPNTVYIVDVNLHCTMPKPLAIIPNIDDAGAKYFLINDPLCNQYGYERYPLIQDFRLLNVAGLSTSEFCQSYITNNEN